jgi:hypothetical protein
MGGAASGAEQRECSYPPHRHSPMQTMMSELALSSLLLLVVFFPDGFEVDDYPLLG